jgi:hypothetical protein
MYPLTSNVGSPFCVRYAVLLSVTGSIYPPQNCESSTVAGSPRVGSRTHVRRKEPLKTCIPMMLNINIANTTKYATLASSGWAVLREWRMVAVPEVMVMRRVVRRTERARKMRT